MLTALVTNLVLAILLISTSAISMPQLYGQAEQNMQNLSNQQQKQGIQQQNPASESPLQNVPKEKELTAEDVKKSNLVLLQGVDSAIQSLEESQRPPTGGFNFNTSNIAQLVETGQLDAAIRELKNLQAEVVKAFGQEAANKQAVPQIQNLIGVLEKQVPSPQ
jgi:hypothetical protein